MREYLKKAGIRACVYFTIAMLFWCVAGLMFAGPVEGVVITLSLLLAMGLLTLLQTLWFTPLVARRMHYPVYVRNLREKIEADPTNPVYLQTVWGHGYRLGGEDGRSAAR